ncbi:MAG TPA: GNAT family N-acetyltransferase [Glaciihabitans sp.]|nr:GNAT family N-acetyltransferase [Glaciihabitans sp.]
MDTTRHASPADTVPGSATERAEATIRRATPADAELLHRIAADTFALACPPHTTPQSIAAFIAKSLSRDAFSHYLASENRVLLIAEADATPLGYTMLVFEDPTDAEVAAAVTTRPTAELSKVYVAAEAHGTGVAANLMRESIAQARVQGAASLWLGVNQENQRANRFYEKHGFTLVGTKHFLVGDRLEDDFVRELLL